MSPSGDRSKRFQRLHGDNSLTFAPVPPGQAYQLTTEVDGGGCTDDFQIVVDNAVLYQFLALDGPDEVRVHQVVIPGALVTSEALVVTFRNTSRDNCGLAAVYNLQIAPTQGTSSAALGVPASEPGSNVGHVDELIVYRQALQDYGGVEAVLHGLIPDQTLSMLEDALAADPNVDGLMPLLFVDVPALNERTGKAVPGVVLAGVDPSRLDQFGGLQTPDGDVIDLGATAADEVVLSATAAKPQPARRGSWARLPSRTRAGHAPIRPRLRR